MEVTLSVSSAAAWVAPDLLKAPAILSDKGIRRLAVDQEDLKLNWKWENRPQFSCWSTILLFTSFSKTLLTVERRLTGWEFLAIDLSPTFLNTGATNETFQQPGEQESFRHILKNSVSMFKSF